ncbi:OmpA family protein [Brevibacterium yomogidense]|uniref:OmpA family protein n=1 Tax=Brevibacterium yomogidense TaxID=946573 RepID=UPI0018DFAEAF
MATALMLVCGVFGTSTAFGAGDRDVTAASATSTDLEQVSDYVNPDSVSLQESVVDLKEGRVALNDGVVDLTESGDAIEPVETVEESASGSMITLDTDILFDFDSADLSDDAQKKIEELTEDIPTGATVTVAGHTDSRGEDDYNQDLSERRAEAVAQVLTDAEGSLTVETEGHGAKDPVASETTDGEDDPDGRAQNRRVEITFDD